MISCNGIHTHRPNTTMVVNDETLNAPICRSSGSHAAHPHTFPRSTGRCVPTSYLDGLMTGVARSPLRIWLLPRISMVWLTVSSLLILSRLRVALGAQSLGERSFKELSPGQVAFLASNPDPLKNLDPDDSSSHLSKILIPRPRKCPRFLFGLAAV